MVKTGKILNTDECIKVIEETIFDLKVEDNLLLPKDDMGETNTDDRNSDDACEFPAGKFCPK